MFPHELDSVRQPGRIDRSTSKQPMKRQETVCIFRFVSGQAGGNFIDGLFMPAVVCFGKELVRVAYQSFFHGKGNMSRAGKGSFRRTV